MEEKNNRRLDIIAIIPARAGSKGIPNKNLRLVNGNPLVYYAIHNAMVSRYISRVIVSTDSKLVAGLAEQMGVEVHWRDASLSGDAITLDAVIFDAIADKPAEYVVTLQPTSPTLSSDTLDRAIAHALKTHADTVISVVNHPHLAWKLQGDAPVPAYAERKNRQYLPPYFMETGAFVISRREVVTQETRFGKHIELFSLPEEEAIDIDTFPDLFVANHILSHEKVAIYVNGNHQRGTGHVYRALELADEFYSKPDIYYDRNQTERAVFGQTTHRLMGVDGIHELFVALKKNGYSLLINDILQTTPDYMIALRRILPQAKIVNFEDDGEGSEYADLVINALYSDKTQPNQRVGAPYYICGKSFLFYAPIAIRDEVRNCFISFGGADPQHYTERVLRILTGEHADEFAGIHFTFALGRAKQDISELMQYNQKDNIDLHYDVENMPGLMSAADVAVTSRGRTGYELAILGIPTMAMAQNEREEKHAFISEANGFQYLGRNPSDEAIYTGLKRLIGLSSQARANMQRALLQNDLRHGRRKVMGAIHTL